MRLVISSEIAGAYPDLAIGIILARGLDNRGSSPELRALAVKSADRLATSLGREGLLQHPHILAWRETYKSFGAKPKKTRPTAEALARRATSGTPPPSINKAVDCYLVAELDWLLPVGGYDLAALRGDVMLRASPGAEEFVGIGSHETESTAPGEVVYSDDAGVLTRRWNFNDCDRAKITEHTTELVLLVEGAHPSIPADAIRGCSDQIASLLSSFCGGEVRVLMLRVAEDSAIELSLGAESRSL
jgi:DNA/RNA-binding domain of Phe-tRNA-synthetase-like protein